MGGFSDIPNKSDSKLNATDAEQLSKTSCVENSFLSHIEDRYWTHTDFEVIFSMKDYWCNNSGYGACRVKLSSGEI